MLMALGFLRGKWGGMSWRSLSLSPRALRRKDVLWVTALAQWLTPEGEERGDLHKLQTRFLGEATENVCS